MATYARLVHNGKIHTVALYEGLDPKELSGLLKSVFGISQEVVGVMGEKGLVIPLSLVSKLPQVLPQSVCKLLVETKEPQPVQAKPWPHGTNDLSSVDAVASASSNVEDIQSDDSTEYISQEILRFITSLRTQNFIGSSQYTALCNLLDDNPTLLFAAYSVAISASDSEYFAEICKDIGNSLQTEQGRASCEALDEVLQICDQLYINNLLTENQLLYLRHLTLIREENVANLYDQFQVHQNASLLAKSLHLLANTHPHQTSSNNNNDTAPAKSESSLKLGKGARSSSCGSLSQNDDSSVGKSNILSTLSGVVALMVRARLITNTEAAVLLEMIKSENDYVVAAFELYKRDKNLEDLQDTLLRCVKLEIRKRVADIQEQELNALEQDQDNAGYDEEENEDNEDAEEDKGDEEEIEIDEKALYNDDNSNDEDNNNEDEEENEENDSEDGNEGDETKPFGLEDISLETILHSLQVNNTWGKEVPEKFLQTIFIAVIRKQLQLEEAKALGDLYTAKYDLVHAAWEVFQVQRDSDDFVDTLKRIVKGLNLKEFDKNKFISKQRQDSKPAATTASSATNAKTKPQLSAQTQSTSTTNNNNSKSTATATDAAEQALKNLRADTDVRRNEAMEAVLAAKRELLKHSLEMMVKQQLTTAEKSTALFRRYLEGDALIEAAIDSYATDRDVLEFLDTLQILANNSKEELDALMQSVTEEEEQENEQEQQLKQRQAPTTSTSSSERAAASIPANIEKSSRNFEELALIQISDIVKEMLRSDMIGPNIANAFHELIKTRDQRLILAYEAYLTNKNGADLVDTLLRIVISTVEGVARQPNSNSTTSQKTSSPKSSNTTSPQKTTQASPATTSDIRTIIPPADMKSVVSILQRAKTVSAEEADKLNNIIDAGDRQILVIFEGYDRSRDIHQLMEQLKALAKTLVNTTTQLTKPAATQAKDNRETDEEEEDSQEEEREDEGADEEGETEEEGNDNEEVGEAKEFDEDDREYIENRFLHIVQNMNLSDIETAALRLAIAKDDSSIRKAIDGFRADMDEENLQAALREAARDTIRSTILDGLDDEDDQDNDEEDEEDEVAYKSNQREETAKKSSSPSKPASSPSNSSDVHISPSNRKFQYSSTEYRKEVAYKYDAAEDEEEEDGDDGEDGDEKDEEDDENNDDEEDDDDYDQVGREEDDEPESGVGSGRGDSNSLLTTQSARDHVFPILVKELEKEGMLSSRDGHTILQQFAQGNPVISAALDLYDTDSDMGQLIETLQGLVYNLSKVQKA